MKLLQPAKPEPIPDANRGRLSQPAAHQFEHRLALTRATIEKDFDFGGRRHRKARDP